MSVTFIQSGRFGFDPTSISGCVLWLDANDAATFTFSSGSLVSQWDDKSGTGNHVGQSTDSLRPTLTATVLNNLPVVEFGASDALQGQVTWNPSTHTVDFFAVARRNSGVADYCNVATFLNTGYYFHSNTGHYAWARHAIA